MLHAELQTRLFILISLQWLEIGQRLGKLHRLIDPQLMAACATCDIELCPSFQADMLETRKLDQDAATINNLLSSHLEGWLNRLLAQ